MLIWLRTYYKLLNIILSLLIKSKPLPMGSKLELGIDISRPIIYVLPNNSKIDLLTLRTQCLTHNLPDPLEPLKLDSIVLPRYLFVKNIPGIFNCHISNRKKSINILYEYLTLHRMNPNYNIQIILTLVMFGRNPGRNKTKKQSLLKMLNIFRKFFLVLWLGRDSFVSFSPAVSLSQIIDNKLSIDEVAKKLLRIANIYFARQLLSIVGPRLPASRKDLFTKILSSKVIIHAIKDEARSKIISYEAAQKNALTLIEEIAACFSYEVIRFSERILRFTWNCLYQGIHVHNAKRLRQLAYEGYGIVYLPCHRSHMDYFLLSYVLYHQGLMTPYIAAGTNLNFWPIGPIFRRLGAFFIRRTFKGNKLYSTIFREYLGEIFSHGHSIEYFIEGGRSRTGRLLYPKTGTLSMTIQAMLRDGGIHPIVLVPVYIGYEHVVEINTYSKELRGMTKEKESLMKMLCGLSKLRNLGYGYVNFGEPIKLITWLNHHVPYWRKSINQIATIRPIWLTPTVNNIASELMIRINNAGAINAINLCCTALLASNQQMLTRKHLTEQLECYLDIMRNTPYSSESTVPNVNATQLIDHALHMKKFEVEKNNIGDDIIILPRKQILMMTYYRNNIAHMFILPSLMAAIVAQHHKIMRHKLLSDIEILYPMLKSELFLRWNKEELGTELDKLTIELLHQGLLNVEDNEIKINPMRLHTLQLLAGIVRETLQRYAIILWLLSATKSINRSSLERENLTLAQHLSVLYGINAPEFFDKAIFNSLIITLRNEGYITNISNAKSDKILKVYNIVAQLINSDIRLTIESTGLSK